MAKSSGKSLSSIFSKLKGKNMEFKASPEFEKFQKNLELFNSRAVYVGFNERSGKYDDEASVADIATFQQFGTSTIPARPFLSDTIDKHQPEIEAMFASAIENVQKGADPIRELNAIGVGAVGMVQEEIVDGDFVPNAPSTIKKKGSDRPLIDTGFMRQHVVYEVK